MLYAITHKVRAKEWTRVNKKRQICEKSSRLRVCFGGTALGVVVLSAYIRDSVPQFVGGVYIFPRAAVHSVDVETSFTRPAR